MISCKKLSSSSPNSAEIVGGNEDLLMEILLFLPAKALIRFKLVNKQWKSLISNPAFVCFHSALRRHRPYPKLEHSFLIHHPTNTSEYFYLSLTSEELVPFHLPFPNTKILQSCHGFLLLEYKRNPWDNRREEIKEYYVWNPTTNQSRKLPLHDIDGYDEKMKPVLKVCLACDPCETPDFYKVVCFWSMTMAENYKIDVYDSRTHAWESCELTDDSWKPGLNRMQQGSVTYWDSVIHWIRRRTGDSFCFDLKTFCFYRVEETPTIPKTGSKRNHVFESNGYLHSALLFSGPDMKLLVVFEMDKDGHAWSNDCSLVNLELIAAAFSEDELVTPEFSDNEPSTPEFSDNEPIAPVFSDNDPIAPGFSDKRRGPAICFLGMIRGDGEEDQILIFHVPGRIVSFRFADEMFEVLVDFRGKSYCWSDDLLQFDFLDTIQFVETLAPV